MKSVRRLISCGLGWLFSSPSSRKYTATGVSTTAACTDKLNCSLPIMAVVPVDLYTQCIFYSMSFGSATFR